MKTKTSKKTSWLKSLTILPLLVIIIYGFSSREIVHNVTDSINNISKKSVTHNINIRINKNQQIFVNNKRTPLSKISEELELVAKENDLTTVVHMQVEGLLNISLFLTLNNK